MTNCIIGGSCHKSQTRDRCIFVATKPVFCRDKTMLVAINASFVGTKPVFCRDKTVLVATKLCLLCLSRQTQVLSEQNPSFVATKLCLPRHNFFRSCHKYHFCLEKARQIFVVTNITLSRQNDKHTFVATTDAFCCYKTFVATKSILAAASANDSKWEGGLYARVDGSLYVHVDFDTQFQEVRIFSHFTVQMFVV